MTSASVQLSLFRAEKRPLPGQIPTAEQFASWVCDAGDACPWYSPCARQPIAPDAKCFAAIAREGGGA